MAGFYGPGGLSGYSPGGSDSGLDPQLVQALMAQFPGLQSLSGQGQQSQPRTLQSLGYQWQGPQLYSGQGAGAFQLSPFESAGGASPESITGGLAQGTFGKSGTQSPLPNTGQGSSILSLPTLSLPMAQVAATQGGYGGMEPMGGQAPQDSSGGFTLNASDVLGAGQTALNLFGGDNLGTQTTTPGFAEQRAGERQDYTGRDLSTLGGSFLTNPLAQYSGQTSGASVTGQLADLLSGPGGSVTEQLRDAGAFDQGPTSYAPGGSAQTALGAQPTDLLGGGLSTLGGLANLYSGIQSGNPGAVISGAGSTLGGLGQLFPESGITGSTLGTVGGAAAAPFAALGLAQAIDAGDPMAIASNLASLYGTTVPVINAIFGTTLPSLSAIAGSALSSLGGAIGGSIGSGIGSLGASLGSIGAGAGAAAGTAAGEAAAGAAAGAGAALPAGMIAGPYVVAKLIQAWQAMGPDKENARQFGNRLQNIMQELPGEQQRLAGIPGIAGQLTPTSTLEQAAAILKQLNETQAQYQSGGWEGYAKSGVTQAKSVGDESGGQGLEASFPDVQRALLESENAYFPLMDVSRLRAQDLLEKNGWTPEQIQAQTGRYISPQEWAQNFGRATYNSSPGSDIYGGNLGSGGGPASSLYNDWMQKNFAAPSQAALAQEQQQAAAEAMARAANGEYVGANPYVYTPQYTAPVWSPEAQAAFAQFQPGGTEQGLANLFGGQFPNPAYAQLGFGQGLQAPPMDPVTQQLQEYVQQMQGLTKNADPIMQAIQTSLQGAPIGSVLPQQPGAPGFTSQAPGGGGVDLMALLRQLGYLGPVEGGFAQGGRVPQTGSYKLHQGEVVLPKALFERVTQLGPQHEQAFQKWYGDLAQRIGLNPNPDDPLHFYDYRGAWQQGSGEPGADMHFTSRYKTLGHPNQYIDDMDTRSGLPINTPKFSLGFPG